MAYIDTTRDTLLERQSELYTLERERETLKSKMLGYGERQFGFSSPSYLEAKRRVALIDIDLNRLRNEVETLHKRVKDSSDRLLHDDNNGQSQAHQLALQRAGLTATKKTENGDHFYTGTAPPPVMELDRIDQEIQSALQARQRARVEQEQLLLANEKARTLAKQTEQVMAEQIRLLKQGRRRHPQSEEEDDKEEDEDEEDQEEEKSDDGEEEHVVIIDMGTGGAEEEEEEEKHVSVLEIKQS